MSKLSVSITLSYVRRCEACVSYARQTVSAALYDGQVTSIRLSAVDRCEHETAKELEARARAPIPPPRPTGEHSTLREGVTAVIPGIEAHGSAVPNGFDSEIA